MEQEKTEKRTTTTATAVAVVGEHGYLSVTLLSKMSMKINVTHGRTDQEATPITPLTSKMGF